MVNSKTADTFSSDKGGGVDSLVHKAPESLHVVRPLFLQQLKVLDGRLVVGVGEQHARCVHDLRGQVFHLESKTK